MEPIVGVLVLFFIVLLAMFSSSSDPDERRPPRDGRRNNRNRHSYTDYRDTEWDEADYDDYPPYWMPPHYPPPHLRRRRGSSFKDLVVSFFMGILVFSAVVGGTVYYFAKDGTPQSSANPGEKTPVLSFGRPPEPLYATVPKPVEPKKVFETLTKPYLIRLTITDLMTYRLIQETYPKRNIEAFLDDNQRYWVCIFANSSEELDEIRDLLRIRENDLKEHGLSIVFYESSDLCSGKILREKGTDIWFCQE